MGAGSADRDSAAATAALSRRFKGRELTAADVKYCFEAYAKEGVQTFTVGYPPFRSSRS
jgi:hypothetical protein